MMPKYKSTGLSHLSDNEFFPRNLIQDPEKVLDGMLVLECPFCPSFRTPIEFDLELHLYEKHRHELLKKFPLRGKGYSMDDRIEYFINQIRIEEQKFEQTSTNQVTPQAIAAEKTELIRSTATVDSHDSKSLNKSGGMVNTIE